MQTSRNLLPTRFLPSIPRERVPWLAVCVTGRHLEGGFPCSATAIYVHNVREVANSFRSASSPRCAAFGAKVALFFGPNTFLTDGRGGGPRQLKLKELLMYSII